MVPEANIVNSISAESVKVGNLFFLFLLWFMYRLYKEMLKTQIQTNPQGSQIQIQLSEAAGRGAFFFQKGGLL